MKFSKDLRRKKNAEPWDTDTDTLFKGGEGG
jgi:hypothetical protein